jgi:hypothetical protein
MSIINTQQRTPAPIQRPEHIQRSSQAVGAEQPLMQNLTDILALLSQDNIDAMLRAPDPAVADRILNQLQGLLGKGDISALLRGPHSEAITKILGDIRTQLSEDNIDARLCVAVGTQAQSEANARLNKKEINFRLAIASPEEFSNVIDGILDELQTANFDTRQRAAQMNTTAKTLTDVGALFSQHTARQ